MDKPPSSRPGTSWLAALLARRPAAAARKRPRADLRLEPLEDRCQPATITVTGAADPPAAPAGAVTLRSAITQAEADSTADTIVFAPSLTGQTLTLGGTALPTLTKGETITGPGAESLTINANVHSRIFSVSSGTPVTVSGLTLSGGNSGVANDGGAILNTGLLTLTNDTVTHNAALAAGGAVANEGATAQLTVTACTFTLNLALGPGGGAIVNATAGAQLSVTDSTFSSNTAASGGALFNESGATATIAGATITANSGIGGAGAGIDNAGAMSISTTTLAFNIGRGSGFSGGALNNSGSLALTASALYDNQSEGGGGAIFSGGSELLTITNTTIANNTALGLGGGGGVFMDAGSSLTLLNDTITGNVDASRELFNAGGVSFNGTVFIMKNTIVAQNAATPTPFGAEPPDVYGMVSSGFNNFVGISTGLSGISDGSNGNNVGTAASPNDPLLGPLQNNGGPTLSRAPIEILGAAGSPSPVVNTGNDAAAATLTTDQRGSPRLVGPHVDIGAVEFQDSDTTFTLSPTLNGKHVSQILAGTAVTLAATITPTAPAPNTPPTGTVTFLDGTTVLGTATMTNGVATLLLNQPPLGHLMLSAQYSGDFNYPAKATAPAALFVVPPLTVGAYDPLRGNWYLRDANSAGAPTAGQYQFGGFGPAGFADGVVGDWTGAGQMTPAVFYPGSGTWFLRTGNGPTNALVVPPFQFGGPTDIPIVGDFFGTGHFDVGVYDVTTSTFYLRNGLNSGAVTVIQFGSPGFGPFYPIAGDFTGSGTWTVGIVQLNSLTWFLKTANTQVAPATYFQWGSPGAFPVLGDWDGQGKEGIGLVVPSNGANLYLLRNETSAGFADAGFFVFGAAGWTPVAGQWQLPTNPLSYQLAAGEGPGAATLSQAQLNTAVAAALGRLQQAGVSQAELGRLASANYQVAALPAGQLGYTTPSQDLVQVSADGAGHGWFVDPTPYQDEEFAGGVAWAGSAAAGKEDLLTVVLHEMGHLVGVPDGGSGLMATVLPTGTRRTDALDAVFAAYVS